MELNAYDLAWCVRRLPHKLRELMKQENIIVSGGYVRASILNEPINDVDLFTNDKSYAKELALEIVEGKEKKLKISDNAITIIGFKHTIQFITRWTYEKPQDIIASFDFTICQASFWWDHYCTKWCSFCSDSFYQDLAAKRLIYTEPIREEEPGGSMLRILKYYQRGYKITLDSLSRIITRLASGVRYDEIMVDRGYELNTEQFQKVIKGLLREVDPNIDPDHIIHE